MLLLQLIHFGAVSYKSCHHQFHVVQIQVSPANKKINLSNFNSDKKTQSVALFWRMYKCRHEFLWNAVKVTVFPQTLTLRANEKKMQGFELWVIVAFASLKPHFPTTLFRPKLYLVGCRICSAKDSTWSNSNDMRLSFLGKSLFKTKANSNFDSLSSSMRTAAQKRI